MENAMIPLDPSFRFTRIVKKMVIALKTALNEVKRKHEDACLLHGYFQQIRESLGEEKTSREEKIKRLESLYDGKFAAAKK